MSRRTPAAAPTISLFPFLAVLLCTMGALLVLLVLFSRSASQAGIREAEAAIEELELARENARWRRDQLDGVRQKTNDDLSRARMVLAGIEENTRELEDELGRLVGIVEALESEAKVADASDLAALEVKLTNARESLDKAREDQASRPAAYAVVPYVGKHGTHRRPLYIECCVDGVFLQPEGIRLTPGDFDGPPGPGNPLASALRAAREQMARTVPNPGDPATQPYPLLLVRPSGVMAYYAAREAISSWGNEFGYQLIEDDWTIAYPPPDVAIAEAENRAIEESRRRLQWLAETHPQRPAKPQRQYRAAPTRGGVVENGGPSVLGDQSQFEWKDQPAGGTPTPAGSRGGRSFNGGGPGVAAGGSASPSGMAGTGNGPGGGAGQGYGGGTGQGPDGGAGDGVAPGRPFLSAAGTPDDPAGDAILASGRGMGGGPGGGGGSPGGPRGPGGSLRGGAAGNGPEGTPGESGGAFGQPGLAAQPGQTNSAQGSAGGGGEAGADGAVGGDAGGRYGSAGGSTFAGGTAGSAAGGAAGGAANGAASGATSGAAGSGNLGLGGSAGGASGGAGGDVSMPGMLNAGGGGGGGAGGGSGSLANSRGANWASLATNDRPVPLTRPIRVECGLNEFRILDDAGRRIQTRVPIDGDTASAIDPFVGALHTKVKNWGLAGDRMYWRPELVLSATSDGQSRRDDLERLLADSGIDVRPRDAKEERVEPLPPVQRASYNLPLK
jgi:hypothetical protein